MKKYFIYLFLLCVSGCSSTPTKHFSSDNEVFIIESQVCLKDKSEKLLTGYSFEEFTGEGIDKQHPTKLLLPYGPLQPTYIGTTVDQSLIYTQKIGFAYNLHSTVFNTTHYSFSFKRDFPMYVYTQNWSQWQFADLSQTTDNQYFLNKLKVRFRAINEKNYSSYVSSYYQQPTSENLDNCD